MAKDLLQARLATSDRAQARAHELLGARLGRLRGLPQKLGQMLSFSAGDDSGLATALAPLQESAEPLPWPVVRAELDREWDGAADSLLTEVDETGRAASLGQVHRARLVDGREVALKVQYPGIRSAVQTDLAALGILSAPVGNLQRGFDLAAYREVLGADLQRELDYRLEATQQMQVGRQWAHDRAIVIPQVIKDLSSETVLVTHWETGEHWDDVRRTWSATDKRQLAMLLLRFFLQGLFQHGQMQADWHPGNVRFRRTSTGPQLVVYDFGCLCEPTRDQRLALARLIQATITGGESPWPLLVKLGFHSEYLRPLAHKLPAVCRVLFEPFCSEHPYDAADWRLSERMAAVLGDDRWNFRIAGPAELVFVVRAFQGLIHYLTGLGVAVNWRSALETAIEPLRDELRSLKLPVCESQPGFAQVSTQLKIRVVQNGETKVQISQAARNIERLRDLLDDELQARIAAAGIDLAAIVHDVRSRGYAPGPVFQLRDGGKQIEVTLE